jgi:hypothetical protein
LKAAERARSFQKYKIQNILLLIGRSTWYGTNTTVILILPFRLLLQV